MRYTYTLRLLDGNGKFFGPGIVQLMEKVEACGSLRSAAQSIHMAYSKAWTILKRAEQALGFPLIDSRKGGRNGGGATITSKGQKFLDKYRAFDNALRRAADGIFEETFAFMPEQHEDSDRPGVPGI